MTTNQTDGHDTPEQHYERAAQHIRGARDVLASVPDADIGDHLALFVLGVLEEYLTALHGVDAEPAEHQSGGQDDG